MPSPRCRVIPLPDDQVSVEIDATERTRWHFGATAERPFFYPFNGPSGHSLTRMGHPGAPDHDHHRSVWFAHAKVLGIDFWSNTTDSRIRQSEWLAYSDGDEEALMAVRLGWFDGHEPRPLIQQDLATAIRPGPDGETFLELQSTFVPTAETLELGQTNFGFLAVRVAANISEHFGGGTLTDSEGRVHEPAIFGKACRWVDYSGPVPGGHTEGVTYFDHPDNIGYPSKWHVREDGWMGAGVCRTKSRVLKRNTPLVLRYLLHAHGGDYSPDRAGAIADSFAARPRLLVEKSTVKHLHFVITRKAR